MRFFDFVEKFFEPYGWPTWLRRGFLLTLPISLPIYLIITIGIMGVLVLGLPIFFIIGWFVDMWSSTEVKGNRK